MFVTYDGKRAPDIAVSRYAVRHLVAAEVSGLVPHSESMLTMTATDRRRAHCTSGRNRRRKGKK